MSKRKSHVKRVQVKGNVNVKPLIWTSPRVKNQSEKVQMTREERILKMELQKVLNGKVFATNIPNEFCMASLFYVVIIK